MEKRSFKRLDASVSLLGFGCMRLPKKNEESMEIDRQAAMQMVDYAMEHGVNYYDTAWIYHNGESEIFIGDALSKYPRDSFMLADKMPIWLVHSEGDVDSIFDKQLEKCKVDYFDFYLLHALDKKSFKKAQKYGVYERLSQFKREGRIKRLGFSFHDGPDALEEIVATYPWDFAQIQLNYLDWEDIDSKRQYEILAKNNIPVIIMEPLRGGALAALNDKANQLLREKGEGRSPASWALRFAMSLDGVLTVLSGMSSLQQLEDNINTVSPFSPLSEAERELVNQVATLYRANGAIPCTNCKYCADCPQGVNIPSIFSIYNNYIATKNIINFAYCYKSLKETEHADRCIECGVCENACPQHIEIIQTLKKIDTEIKNIKPR